MWPGQHVTELIRAINWEFLVQVKVGSLDFRLELDRLIENRPNRLMVLFVESLSSHTEVLSFQVINAFLEYLVLVA